MDWGGAREGSYDFEVGRWMRFTLFVLTLEIWIAVAVARRGRWRTVKRSYIKDKSRRDIWLATSFCRRIDGCNFSTVLCASQVSSSLACLGWFLGGGCIAFPS